MNNLDYIIPAILLSWGIFIVLAIIVNIWCYLNSTEPMNTQEEAELDELIQQIHEASKGKKKKRLTIDDYLKCGL